MKNLSPSPVAGPVTDTERVYAVDNLKDTQTTLHQAVANLSPAQLTYKPDANRWSVAECVEHIVLVERGLFRAVQAGMGAPADAGKRADIQVSDVDVIKGGRSRAFTVVAMTPFVPTGRYGDTKATLNVFDEQRASVIHYLETVTDDLRTHYFTHPVFGTLDLYQAFLLMGAHSERHRKQIDEVKTSPAFPR